VSTLHAPSQCSPLTARKTHCAQLVERSVFRHDRPAPELEVEPEQHGESPATKRRLRNLLDVTGLLGRLEELPGREATEEEILRVHTPEYLARIKSESESGGDEGD